MDDETYCRCMNSLERLWGAYYEASNRERIFRTKNTPEAAKLRAYVEMDIAERTYERAAEAFVSAYLIDTMRDIWMLPNQA